MKCPHCQHFFSPTPNDSRIILVGTDNLGDWGVEQYQCHNTHCQKLIAFFINASYISWSQGGRYKVGEVRQRIPIRPKIENRYIPEEVPKELATDFTEACLVLGDSPKASAALSRRCLQYILQLQGYKGRTLADEIQQALDSNTLPSHLYDEIDSIRNIGNFAAHPLKSEQTGQIQDFEPGEAEWTLDVLESLFDFYYVQPAKAKLRRDTLNQKLQNSGKPPMKG